MTTFSRRRVGHLLSPLSAYHGVPPARGVSPARVRRDVDARCIMRHWGVTDASITMLLRPCDVLAVGLPSEPHPVSDDEWRVRLGTTVRLELRGEWRGR